MLYYLNNSIWEATVFINTDYVNSWQKYSLTNKEGIIDMIVHHLANNNIRTK